MQRIIRFKVVSRKALNLIVLLTFLVLFGCVISTSAGASMRVEVDVFSGRPNPSWDLTAHEAKEFVALFQALPEYQGEGSVRDGLGYRGLIVTQLCDPIEDYNEIVISYGVVVARRNRKSKQFTDKDRRLERWLFQIGRRHLDESLYKQIIQQLD